MAKSCLGPLALQDLVSQKISRSGGKSWTCGLPPVGLQYLLVCVRAKPGDRPSQAAPQNSLILAESGLEESQAGPDCSTHRDMQRPGPRPDHANRAVAPTRLSEIQDWE